MRKLYEINADIDSFEFDIDLETGEIMNFDELDALETERKQKLEGVGLKIKNLEAEKDAVKKEKDNFAAREKRLSKEIDGYKEWLKYALDGQPFKTERLVVSYRRSESVNIVDEFLIPDEYCNFSVERKPDKKMLKDALKHGKEIEGVSIVEKQSVQIK